MAVLFIHCGPSIKQAVQLDKLNYHFHIRTYIDGGDQYDRTLMNIPWIDVEYFKGLEYRRAEVLLDMIDDYEISNWEVIIHD